MILMASSLNFSVQPGSLARDADVDLVINCQLSTGASGTGATALDSTIGLFCRAANAGMFCGRTFAASASECSLAGIRTSGPTISYMIRARSVASSALRVLRNMLLRVHLLSCPIDRVIVLHSNHWSGQDLSEASSLTVPSIPAVSQSTLFQWLIEDVSHPDKNRVIEVELGRPPTEEQAEEIVRLVMLWDQVVEADGFAFEHGAVGQEESFVPGEIYFVHPTILEHPVVSISNADATAYHSLVNLFARVAGFMMPVIRLAVR
jgi:hypothetical protein